MLHRHDLSLAPAGLPPGPLRAAVAVARTGTVTRAAEALALTQPAVSRLVGTLEQAVGFAVFERRRGKLVPTERGLVFLAEAEHLLAEAARLAEFANELRDLKRGKVSVVAMPTLAISLLPGALRRFSAQHPGVEVTVVLQQRREVEAVLAARRFDLGIVALPITTRRMEIEPFHRADAVCLIPRRHRLAKARVVQVADLVEETLIGIGEATLLRERTVAAFQRIGASPRFAIVTDTSELASRLVAEGLGIAVTHALLPHGTQAGVVVRPLDPGIPIDYAFLLPNGRPRLDAARTLMAEIVAEARRV